MIELTQQPDYSFGSKEAISALNEKDQANLLLISDSHGNKRVLQAIIENFGSKCDALCFCGDGANDLIESLERGFFDPEFGKNIPPVLFFVRGNGDNSTSTIFTDQRIPVKIPETQEFYVAGAKFFLTHGHRYNVYYGLKDLKNELTFRNADMGLYGHTHVPNAQNCQITINGEKKYYGVLNPGSCAQARGGMPNTFTILTSLRNKRDSYCTYYKVTEDKNDIISFEIFSTPLGEIKLF